MNCSSKNAKGTGPISTADSVAVKNTALGTVFDYLEYKNGPGEWFKNELTDRLPGMTKLALEAPCNLNIKESVRFMAQGQPSQYQP